MEIQQSLYLLDTDIIIYWLKSKHLAINRKISQIGDDNIFISSITAAELYFGAYNSARKKENTDLIDEFTASIKIIAFDEKAGKYFGKIKAQLKNKGQIISDSDIFIAATAILHNCTLVTNNQKHFKRIEGLKLENWVS